MRTTSDVSIAVMRVLMLIVARPNAMLVTELDRARWRVVRPVTSDAPRGHHVEQTTASLPVGILSGARRIGPKRSAVELEVAG